MPEARPSRFFPSPRWRAIILWALFALVGAAGAASVVYSISRPQGGAVIPHGFLSLSPLFDLVFLPALALLLLHAWWTLGYRRGSLLLALAGLTGLAFELYGVNAGWGFGGLYAYGRSAVALSGVPLLIPVFWAAFIYAGYSVVSALARLSGRGLPRCGRPGWLFACVMLDGALVVALDLVMDPLQVASGHWAWREPGIYYGVPLANFGGWFLVVILAAGVFRALEYFRPGTERTAGAVFLIPVAGYCLLAGGLALLALKSGLALLAPVGLAAMLAPPIVLLLCLRRARSAAPPLLPAGAAPGIRPVSVPGP